MSDLEKFGTRTDPVMSVCSKCGDPTPLAELSADDWCPLCESLARLRDTLEKKGIVHPQLFDRNRQLPRGDR